MVGIISLLLSSAVGCQGTIPAPLREPAQEAVEQAVKAPELGLYVNIGRLSSSGLNVSIEARIGNSNRVTLEIGNLRVVAKGETGRTYIQDTMLGGSIGPNSNRTFARDITIPLDILSERSMVVVVNTRAGAAGIALPVTATVTVNIPDIENLISVPRIALSVNVGRLSSNGLDTSLQANISNPNPVSLDIGDLQIVVRGRAGNVITTTTMIGGSVAPNSSGTFMSEITIPLQVLNETSITISVDTRTGVAGITLPLSAVATIQVPRLNILLSAPQIEVDIEPKWKATFPLPSLELLIKSKVTNNNNIGLIIGDLSVGLYKSDGSLVKSTSMAGGTTHPMSARTFQDSVVLGPELISLIGSYATVRVNTEVGIDGINERIAISAKINFPVKLAGLP